MDQTSKPNLKTQLQVTAGPSKPGSPAGLAQQGSNNAEYPQIGAGQLQQSTIAPAIPSNHQPQPSQLSPPENNSLPLQSNVRTLQDQQLPPNHAANPPSHTGGQVLHQTPAASSATPGAGKSLQEPGEEFAPNAFDDDSEMEEDDTGQAQLRRNEEMARIQVPIGTPRIVPPEILKIFESVQVSGLLKKMWTSGLNGDDREIMRKLNNKVKKTVSRLSEPQSKFEIPWETLQFEIEQIVSLAERVKEGGSQGKDYSALVYASALFCEQMKEMRIPIMNTIPQQIKNTTGQEIKRMIELGLVQGPSPPGENTGGSTSGPSNAGGFSSDPGNQGGLNTGSSTGGLGNVGGLNNTPGNTVGPNAGSTDLIAPPTREQRGTIASYGRGFTPFGVIEAVKPYGGKGCRILLNCGTTTRPRYRLCNGSTFGKGAYKTLLEDFSGSWETGDIKKRIWAEVGKVDYAVQYAETPGTKKSPHGYVHVVYNQKNSQPQYPEEWLTFSDFLNLAGEANAVQHLTSIQEYNRQDEEYFASCAQNGIHPDTKRLLNAEDKQRQPWLGKQQAYIEPRFSDRVMEVAHRKAVLAPPTRALLTGPESQVQGVVQAAPQMVASGFNLPGAFYPQTPANLGGTFPQSAFAPAGRSAISMVRNSAELPMPTAQAGPALGVNALVNQFPMPTAQAGPALGVNALANQFTMPTAQAGPALGVDALANQLAMPTAQAGPIPGVNALASQFANLRLPPPPPPPPALKPTHRAIYDYKGVSEVDLNIAVGEALMVKQHNEQGWSLVLANSGKEGLVPSSYIAPI